jgi:hypothetical protein
MGNYSLYRHPIDKPSKQTSFSQLEKFKNIPGFNSFLAPKTTHYLLPTNPKLCVSSSHPRHQSQHQNSFSLSLFLNPFSEIFHFDGQIWRAHHHGAGK